MRLLLDTKVWLWWLSDDPRLGARARAVIADPANDVFISVASVWELVTKRNRAVKIGGRPRDRIREWLERDGFHILPVELGTIFQVLQLALESNDVFDQLLIAQATTRGLVFVTDDRYPFERHHVDVIVATDQGSR